MNFEVAASVNCESCAAIGYHDGKLHGRVGTLGNAWSTNQICSARRRIRGRPLVRVEFGFPKQLLESKVSSILLRFDFDSHFGIEVFSNQFRKRW